MRGSPMLTDKAIKDIEDNFDNQMEAFRLLDLIDAEFRSDPSSTACFDLGIVDRVRQCVQRRRDFVIRNPVYGD